MTVEILRPERLQQAQPEDYQLGHIGNRYPVAAEQVGIAPEDAPKVEYVEVYDPWVEHLESRKPGRTAEIKRLERDMSGFAHLRSLEGAWERKPGGAYIDENGEQMSKKAWEYGDPVSRDRFFGDGGILGTPALQSWRTTVPSAVALEPLVKPLNIDMVFDRKGNLVEADDTTREWMTVCTDGWAIRERATLQAYSAAEHVRAYADAHPGEQVTMVSVASGTALPTLLGAKMSGVEDIRLVLLEKDGVSQMMAKELARKLDFKGQVDIREVDVFDPKQMAEAADQIQAEGGAHYVDAVGIEEYSDPSLRETALGKRYGEDYMLFDPTAFTKAVLAFGRPGSRTNIGQMRSDRPVADFTFGVVCWPHVCMRSPAEFNKILVDAGAEPKDVTLSFTSQEVYTMATIDKPLLELVTDKNIEEHTRRARGSQRRLLGSRMLAGILGKFS